MATIQTALLSGEITAGLFPTEKSVVVRDHRGLPVSFLVDKSLVIVEDGNDFVIVQIVDSKENAVLVLLPGETFGGDRWITVSKEQLQLQPV